MGLYQWIFVCFVLVLGQGQKGDVGVKGKVGKDGDKGTRGDQEEKGDRFGANEVNDGVDDDDDATDEREAEAKNQFYGISSAAAVWVPWRNELPSWKA